MGAGQSADAPVSPPPPPPPPLHHHRCTATAKNRYCVGGALLILCAWFQHEKLFESLPVEAAPVSRIPCSMQALHKSLNESDPCESCSRLLPQQHAPTPSLGSLGSAAQQLLPPNPTTPQDHQQPPGPPTTTRSPTTTTCTTTTGSRTHKRITHPCHMYNHAHRQQPYPSQSHPHPPHHPQSSLTRGLYTRSLYTRSLTRSLTSSKLLLVPREFVLDYLADHGGHLGVLCSCCSLLRRVRSGHHVHFGVALFRLVDEVVVLRATRGTSVHRLTVHVRFEYGSGVRVRSRTVWERCRSRIPLPSSRKSGGNLGHTCCTPCEGTSLHIHDPHS